MHQSPSNDFCLCMALSIVMMLRMCVISSLAASLAAWKMPLILPMPRNTVKNFRKKHSAQSLTIASGRELNLGGGHEGFDRWERVLFIRPLPGMRCHAEWLSHLWHPEASETAHNGEGEG